MTVAKTCLVIDAEKTSHVLLDGPALRITMKCQSPRLFPLRRVARIHVIGQVENSFDAMVACAEKQIPVAFFTKQGKLRCQLYYPIFENGVISHWFEHVEFDEEAKRIYSEWLACQTLNLLAYMGFKKCSSGIRQQLVVETLNHHCKKILGNKKFELAMEWLSGIMSVHFSQVIVKQGLANQSRGKRKLMEDVGPLCEIWLKVMLLNKIQNEPININAREMSNFYQEQSEFIEYTLTRMIVQLATKLESII